MSPTSVGVTQGSTVKDLNGPTAHRKTRVFGLCRLPRVTEANFETDLGKFGIVFASANDAFMPVDTRH